MILGKKPDSFTKKKKNILILNQVQINLFKKVSIMYILISIRSIYNCQELM